MPTTHISANKGEIAKIVLMPGDPLRAKYIAENFLQDIKQINRYRGMYGWTGKYEGREITVMGSGMGHPSIGIYSYELFSEFGVDKIIRIGTCGSYKEDIEVGDVVISTKIWSEGAYHLETKSGLELKDIVPSQQLVNQVKQIAKDLDINIKEAVTHSSDVFYCFDQNFWKEVAKKADVVEMEALALYTNAIHLKKEALCVLTVSDNLISGKQLTPEEREWSLKTMFQIALAIK